MCQCLSTGFSFLGYDIRDTFDVNIKLFLFYCQCSSIQLSIKESNIKINYVQIQNTNIFVIFTFVEDESKQT